ncbi:MAG: amidohydrolase family protein [Nitriliruptorales bacterium]
MFALRGARLFDGVSRTLVEHALVLIEDGRIREVAGGGVEPPEGVEIIELGDVTLLPGLFDCHVHLGFDASLDPAGRMNAEDDSSIALRMRLSAQRTLAAGVTTVRDLGDRAFLGVTLREWFARGEEIGPEVVAAGPPLTVTGGHCYFMGGEVDGELAVRRAVRSWFRRGVDVIKIMAGGGVLTPGIDPFTPQFSLPELRAAVEEAHRFGRKVTAHAHGVEVVRQAVEAGVDGIEHGGCMTLEGAQADPALLDRLAEKEIVVCPTLAMLPAEALAGLPPLPSLIASHLDAMKSVIAQMHRAGVRLIAGSDAGVGPAKPHDLLPHAILDLADIGLSTVEALRAATSLAAATCGLGDRKGRLEPGKDADILAVAGNPLTNLAALLDVRGVLRAGRWVQTSLKR